MLQADDAPPHRPVLTLLRPPVGSAPQAAASDRPGDVPGAPGDDHSGRVPRERLVAGDVATLLGTVPPGDAGSDTLALPLALSVSMRRHGIDADELVLALRLLRAAVLAVAGLDPSVEPVPLGGGDPVAAALHLGRYVHSLLERAALVSGCHPAAVAEAVAAHLQAA